MRTATGAELAIVTGASSGIGAALARELSRRGRPVLAVARRADRLAALADEAHAKGAVIHTLALDVTSEGAASALRDRARALGGAGWLVNNAGCGFYGRLDTASAERVSQLVRLNCEAVVTLTHALLPDLLRAGRGQIVNVASVVGFLPSPFMSIYGATKSFVIAFSEGLAEELRGTGVRVTAFCPGAVVTEFGIAAGYHARPRRPLGQVTADQAAVALIDAVESGAVLRVPGLLNKSVAAMGRFLPRGWVRRLAGLALRGTAP